MATERVATWGPIELGLDFPYTADFVPLQAGDRVFAVATVSVGDATDLTFDCEVRLEKENAEDTALPITNAGLVRVMGDAPTPTITASAHCVVIAAVYRGLPSAPFQVFYKGASQGNMPTGTFEDPTGATSPNGRFTVVRCAVAYDECSEPIVVSGNFQPDPDDPDYTVAAFIAETVDYNRPLTSATYASSTWTDPPWFGLATLISVALPDPNIGVLITSPTNPAPIGAGRYPIR